LNSLLRNAFFWEKSKEPRKREEREREERGEREKTMPLIMATYVCHAVRTAHALRSPMIIADL
jgi:hypothetical protein